MTRPSWSVLLGLASALAVAVALLNRLAGRVRVTGPSMSPTLLDGDRVLVNYHAYGFRPPRTGEIVVANLAGVPGGWTVKRVAAGDNAPAGGALRSRAYLLLGDNPLASTDSRRFGTVSRRAIRGRVWYRYWPPERRGSIR